MNRVTSLPETLACAVLYRPVIGLEVYGPASVPLGFYFLASRAWVENQPSWAALVCGFGGHAHAQPVGPCPVCDDFHADFAAEEFVTGSILGFQDESFEVTEVIVNEAVDFPDDCGEMLIAVRRGGPGE